MTENMLFVVGPALGHVVRSRVVANALASIMPVSIQFAGVQQGHGPAIISSDFPYHELPGMDREGINYAVALEELIAKLSPDLICLDLSPHPWLLQVRFPDIQQVYLTNFFLTQEFSYSTHQELLFKKSARQINKTRASRGLAPIRNIKAMYNRHAVINCDPAGFVGSDPQLPPNYHVTGPCIWEPDLQLPEELSRLDDVLFISFGSTGLKPLPTPLAEEIAMSLNIKDIIWLGNSLVHQKTTTGAIRHRFYAWLPASQILKRARFVITQGGTGSTYQALANGNPVGVWPSHQNQKILGSITEDVGCGLLVDDVAGISQLIANKHHSMLSRSKSLSESLSTVDGPMNAARVIAKML